MLLIIITFLLFHSSNSYTLHPLIAESFTHHTNHTTISPFRVLNRRVLSECSNLNPYLEIKVNKTSDLDDDEFVSVTVGGVLVPDVNDWVAMISPADSE